MPAGRPGSTRRGEAERKGETEKLGRVKRVKVVVGKAGGESWRGESTARCRIWVRAQPAGQLLRPDERAQHIEGSALLCRPAVAQQGSCDAMPL
jgi:hypothetical protein